MAMQTLGDDDAATAGGEPSLSADINTTPLVDVMLVLLIIFLVTVPAVTQTVAVSLPRERVDPVQARVGILALAVDRDGRPYWGAEPLTDIADLRGRLARATTDGAEAPEVHIRADENARWEEVAAVHLACVDAGYTRVGFITDPNGPGSRLER